MDQVEYLPPNADITPQKSVVINPGTTPADPVGALHQGVVDFNKRLDSTVAARAPSKSLAERIAGAKTIAPSGGQVYINEKIYTAGPDLSKSFPFNEIHTILKLKGMDAQQAEQALTMIKAVW